MISFTPEQREYKEKTLNQLLANQSLLEASLGQERRPEVVRSIEEQLEDIEAHISRLRDELAGNVVFDEPIAEDLFKEAARALAKEKFFLAKKHIHRLETIEPFYPGIDRLKQEAESGRVSRRTRSIAQGLAASYPGTAPPPAAKTGPVEGGVGQSIVAQNLTTEPETERTGWLSSFFQFHIIISCLVVLLLICVMLGIGGITFLQWFIEGG